MRNQARSGRLFGIAAGRARSHVVDLQEAFGGGGRRLPIASTFELPQGIDSSPHDTQPSGWVVLWREHRLFLALISAHLIAGLIVDLFGRADVVRLSAWRPSIFVHFLQFALLGGPAALLWHRTQVRDDQGRRLPGMVGWLAAASQFRQAHLNVPGLGGVIVIALGVAASTAIHDGWKGSIAQLHTYNWDPVLMSVDRVLHLGVDPWRLLHPIFGSPPMTQLLDALYWWWYAGLMIGITWQAWSLDRATRQRFFVAYALTWIVLGSVIAHLVPSVGPCFLQRLSGDPSFEPLMSYLREVNAQRPLVAINLQDVLWASYREGRTGHWMAISAMPSLHIAIPALFALATGRAHRALGVAVWIYTALVLLGSIHLGWHYAVDGYVGILGALGCWWFAGWLQHFHWRS